MQTDTRDDVEHAAAPLISLTLKLCAEAVAAAKLNGVVAIDDVIMSGGVTFTPTIQDQVRDFFFPDRPQKQLFFPDDPSTVVGRGAAIYAGMLMGRIPYARVGERVSPFSYGVACHIGYPTDKNRYFSVLIERDQQLFDRNGRPQAFSGRDYYTMIDNQTTMAFEVLQASSAKTEKRLASKCITIGSFPLSIQAAAAAGENGVKLSFAIDKNGILEIRYSEILTPENQGMLRFNMLLHADSGGPATT